MLLYNFLTRPLKHQSGGKCCVMSLPIVIRISNKNLKNYFFHKNLQGKGGMKLC